MSSDIFNTIGSGLTLGSAITSLFGSDQANGSGSAQANANATRPYQNPIVSPGYTFAGGTLTPRDSSYADSNKTLNQLYGNQLGALNAFSTQNLAPLSARLAPGYGQLTQSAVNDATSAGQKTYGNLRDQLAQRGILGASFADNQLSQQASQNQQDIDTARAQAFQQEMQATLGLNQQQADVLASQLANANAQASQVNQVAAQKLNELGIEAGFLKNVQQTDTPANNAYKAAAIQQALGAAGGAGGTPPPTGGTGAGGTGTNPPAGNGSFSSLPVPTGDAHRWTQAYKQFAATGDYAGYLAWLQANHKGGF